MVFYLLVPSRRFPHLGFAGLEFSYSQSPTEVQGYTMGMYLVTNGAGFLLGSALLVIVNSATSPGLYEALV